MLQDNDHQKPISNKSTHHLKEQEYPRGNLEYVYKAIEDIADKYNSFGKKVKLRHLTKDCHKLLSRSGQLVVDSDDDPDYGVAVDYGVKLGIFGK